MQCAHEATPRAQWWEGAGEGKQAPRVPVLLQALRSETPGTLSTTHMSPGLSLKSTAYLLPFLIP